MSDVVLDDVWAEEAGRSVRFVSLDGGKLRIEFTSGVGNTTLLHATLTLTDYRTKRVIKALVRTYEEVRAEPPLEHIYPSEHLPGSHWAVTEAWTIVDAIKPGVLSEDVRCYLAGTIAGTLVRLRQELS